MDKQEVNIKEYYNKHYIILHNSYIIDGWSNGPHPEKDISDAICINDKSGYQFKLFPDGEENPNLFDLNGIPLYKYEDEEILLLTQTEKNIYKTIQENKQLPTIKL